MLTALIWTLALSLYVGVCCFWVSIKNATWAMTPVPRWAVTLWPVSVSQGQLRWRDELRPRLLPWAMLERTTSDTWKIVGVLVIGATWPIQLAFNALLAPAAFGLWLGDRFYRTRSTDDELDEELKTA